MQIPAGAIGAALARPTEIGRMLESLRNRPGAALVAFHKSIGTARALAEIGRTIPVLTERQEP